MTRQYKVLILICALTLIGALFFWFNKSTPWAKLGVPIGGVGVASSAAASGKVSSAVLVAEPNSAAVTPTLGTVATIANSASSASGLSWSKALGMRDTRWAIEQLAISADPNERLRGYALSVICTKILLQPPGGYAATFEERKITPQRQQTIGQMRDDMQARCGMADNGNPYLPSAATRQGMWSARAAQVPLAIAFDAKLNNVAKNGVVASEADALSFVMKDESLRSAWVAQGLMSSLGQELSTSPSFAGVPAEEMTAALMTMLCRSGDDCGADSLYRPYLCFTSGFRFCGGKNINEAITAELSSENSVRFENTVRQLQVAFSAGDLDALGFRRKKSS